MKLYLAAAWSRKHEIKQIANLLRAVGLDVQARWLDEPDLDSKPSLSYCRERAMIDVSDVRTCDVLVRFSDDLSKPTIPSYLATGSRMFEMGLAYGAGKPIIVIGGHQPIFDHLPNVVHLPDTDSLIEYLTG